MLKKSNTRDYRKFSCIVLDLEPDHAGRVTESYSAWEKKKILKLLSLLKKHKVKLSIFVVGKTLFPRKEIINIFQNNKAEFHLHSYSHNLQQADTEKEIAKGKKEFINFFGTKPQGYRAPGGLITHRGLKLLKKYDFKFDSSVIPSFWPKRNYFFYPRKPFFIFRELLEIPFSVVPFLRIVISLSWIRLLGLSFYKFLFIFIPLPNPFVLSFHLHDIWRVPAYHKLPLRWKLVYFRNNNDGFETLEKIIKYLSLNEYKFITIKKLAKYWKAKDH